jgi:hypothetical protein
MHTASLAASFAFATPPSSTRNALHADDPALPARGKELFPYLQEVPDPRGRRGRRYDVAVLLGFCLVGFCTGARAT